MSFEEFIDGGECFLLNGECVSAKYIYGLVAVEEINDDSFIVSDNGIFKVLSYM